MIVVIANGKHRIHRKELTSFIHSPIYMNRVQQDLWNKILHTTYIEMINNPVYYDYSLHQFGEVLNHAARYEYYRIQNKI